MKLKNKLILTAAVCAFGMVGSVSTHAVDFLVGGTLTASAAVNATKNADMDFASLDYSAGHVGVVELGPDANIQLTGGGSGLVSSGAPVAGEIAITDSTNMIDVSCETGGVLSDGTRAITLQNVKWDQSNAVDYTTAANTCAGLATVVTIDASVTNNPSIYIGAELDVTVNSLNGSSSGTAYDTATGTGDPVTFRVVIQ